MRMSFEYIAGFFDGEGSIYAPIGRNVHTPHLALPQSGPEGKQVLDEIAAFLESKGIDVYRMHPRLTSKIGKKPMHTIEIGNMKSATLFLQAVLPYLRVKKVKAQDVLRFVKMCPSIRGRSQREYHAKRRAQGIPYHHARRVAVAA